MLRKTFSFGSALLLAGAAILATPSDSQAQRGGRGGGHYGGGRGGYYGGGRGGIGFGIGNFGGYRSGIYRNYGAPLGGYGLRSYSRPYYRNSGVVPFYNNYGYSSPNYGNTYSSNSYDDVAPYVANDLVEPSTSLYYPATDPNTPDTRAHLAIHVPPDAQVWFGDTPTNSTGSVRRFDSPPLNAGSEYSYVIRARWNENGREVTQSQNVDVTAGSRVDVRFPTRDAEAPRSAIDVR